MKNSLPVTPQQHPFVLAMRQRAEVASQEALGIRYATALHIGSVVNGKTPLSFEITCNGQRIFHMHDEVSPSKTLYAIDTFQKGYTEHMTRTGFLPEQHLEYWESLCKKINSRQG